MTGAARAITIDELIDEFETRLQAAGLLEHLEYRDLNADGEDVCLDRLVTRKERRGKGYAMRALKILTDLCDQRSVNLRLTVRPLDELTSAARLRNLYSRYGFVAVGGTENEMRREFRK